MKTGCVYNITVGEIGFYIGSTENFDKRLTKHNVDKKTSNIKLYKAIRENGGKFVMTKLYDILYVNDVELRIEERKCYNKMNPTLNTYRPHITKEELKEYRIQYKKQYSIDNADKIKKFYQDNADKIKEQRKQYYIDNPDKIKEANKKSYNKNKETIKEQNKQRYNKNKETIKERANKKTTCDCGCEVNYSCLKRHQKSVKHIQLMADKNC